MSSMKRDEAGGEATAAAAVGRKRPLSIPVRNSGGHTEHVAQELWCRRQEHDKIIVALTREHSGLLAALRRKAEGKLVCPGSAAPLRADLKRRSGIRIAAVRLVTE